MRTKLISLLLIVTVVLTLATLTSAAPDALSLTWWTAGGGGGRSSGEAYTLNGTLGQPEAGPTMSGGDYTLSGGFWGGVPSTMPNIYLPFIQH